MYVLTAREILVAAAVRMVSVPSAREQALSDLLRTAVPAGEVEPAQAAMVPV